MRDAFTPQLMPREVGTITSIATGIAKVSGLPGVGFEELVKFPGGVFGIAFNVDEDEIGVVLLGDYWHLHAGDEVERTGRVMDVAVGDGLVGRVIDPLGRPLDGKGPVVSSGRLPIERPAAPIMDRAPVTVPLQTGLKVIDALIPIGRGQRELILGDRQTGKTAIAIDTILNQRGQDVLCVYCAIGQRASAVAKVVANLREKGAMEYTVVVVTEGNDPPGLAYIAPYAATSIAEHFMEAGRDVLIVYDDLTQHARAYRELSLLLRRPPGREAFPGDIFYIHSRLLERATHLRAELGGGSLTALPIIETEAQDISAYIPTNLISITDGQIYLSPSLFELGVLPAVDVAKSVSRVGGKAQRAAYRAVAGDLKLAYAQFEELETFARFGARVDEDTRKVIDHGRRIRACLKQPEFAPVSVPAQIAVLLALTAKLFDPVPLDRMTDAEQRRAGGGGEHPGGGARALRATAADLNDADRKAIIAIARQALAPFYPKPDSEPEAKPEPERKPEVRANGKPSPKASLEEVMSETTASLRRKIDSAGDLQSVVRTMKALAASSIGQYERSVRALADYYRTVELGLGACFREGGPAPSVAATGDEADRAMRSARSCSVPTRDWWASSTRWWPTMRWQPSARCHGRARVWAVGERVHARLADAGLPLMGLFAVPKLGQGDRPARRADSRGNRGAAQPARSHRAPPLLQPAHIRRGLCARPSATAAAGRGLATQADRSCLGRPRTCPRSWAAALRRCARSSASISSSRSSGRAPNPLRARTRAAWQRWSAPTRTSTSCWRRSTEHSIVCVKAASTRSCSTSSPASRRCPSELSSRKEAQHEIRQSVQG